MSWRLRGRVCSIRGTVIAITTAATVLAGCAGKHGHVDNNPCTYPYKALPADARLAKYYDEAGQVVLDELIATDSSMSPGPDGVPHPHYFVRGRCAVQLVDPGAGCGGATPFTCTVGNRTWCSSVRC